MSKNPNGYTPNKQNSMVHAPMPENAPPPMDDNGNPMDPEMVQLNNVSRSNFDRENVYQEWDKGTTTRIKSIQSMVVKQRDRPDPVQVKTFPIWSHFLTFFS